MNFFDGLPSYQIVLLVLGALFFLVLVLAFVTLIVREKPFGKLPVFFIVPVVMIGFPGIKSFQYKGLVITLSQTTTALQNDPTSASLRENLQGQVKQAADKPNQSPQTIVKIATAQFALGEEAAAKTALAKVLQTSSVVLPDALALRNRIELNDRLKAMTANVEQHPQDVTAKANLKETIVDVSRLPIANPQFLANIAQAHAVIGNQTEALTFANKALVINPNLGVAKQVKSQVMMTKSQP